MLWLEENRHWIAAAGIAIVGILVAVGAVVDSARRTRPLVLRARRIPDRDAAFEEAFAEVDRIIAGDLAIEKGKLLPSDRLEALGYLAEADDWNDSAQTICEIIGEELGIEAAVFAGCQTVEDVTKRLLTMRIELTAKS